MKILRSLPPFDLALVAITIAIAEAEIWLPSGACVGGNFPFGLCNFGESLGPRAVAVVYTTAAALTLLGRRRWPMRVLVVVAALSVLVAVIWVASPGLGFFIPLLVSAYSVGRYHRGQHPWLTLTAAGAIVFATSVIHDLHVPGQVASGTQATYYLIALGALPMGRAMQTQDLRAELAAAEAREQRSAREEAARQAVEEERARIAREMHDVASHGTSLIVVQAVAAQEVFASNPERARSALVSIESEARSTLQEIRRLVAGIRPGRGGDDGDREAPETLEQLVARVKAAGQPVQARLECQSLLSEEVQLTVYRCLQEALTNAVKHAPGVDTAVAVSCADGTLHVEVENGPCTTVPASTNPGRGLAGMRERVMKLGGSLVAEPTAEGGFRLRASIPVVDPG